MEIRTESMIIKTTATAVTELSIKGHNETYLYTETGLEFFKKMPEFLSQIAKDENEYDKLYIEFRRKLCRYLYDEKDISDLLSNFTFIPLEKQSTYL